MVIGVSSDSDSTAYCVRAAGGNAGALALKAVMSV